jgi:hypothetical protein
MVISDVPLPPMRRTRWLREAAGWALSLGVLAVFFVGQAWLQTAVTGVGGTVLLTLSVVAEFALLGALHQRRIRE